MNAPTVAQLAQTIADHYDADLGLADVEPPNAADIALAQKIRNQIDTATHLEYVADDIHGYSQFFRGLLAGSLITAIVAAIIIFAAWSAS